ncbi:MAG: hypothetical protein OHK0015_27790 [Chloroflexi bacterium OHK40]
MAKKKKLTCWRCRLRLVIVAAYDLVVELHPIALSPAWQTPIAVGPAGGWEQGKL